MMTEEILAPLAGTVISIEVALGEDVEEDQDVVILESLKIETPIFASSNGKVKEIKVKKGDKVEEDDILIVLE